MGKQAENIVSVSVVPVKDVFAVYHVDDNYYKSPVLAIACVHKVEQDEHWLHFKTIEFTDIGSAGYIDLEGDNLNDTGNFCGVIHGSNLWEKLTPAEVMMLNSEPTH